MSSMKEHENRMIKLSLVPDPTSSFFECVGSDTSNKYGISGNTSSVIRRQKYYYRYSRFNYLIDLLIVILNAFHRRFLMKNLFVVHEVIA
jgi:hypothetical protein